VMEGHCGGHFGWANRAFIARYVAPLLAASVTPAPPSATASDDEEERNRFALLGGTPTSGAY